MYRGIHVPVYRGMAVSSYRRFARATPGLPAPDPPAGEPTGSPAPLPSSPHAPGRLCPSVPAGVKGAPRNPAQTRPAGARWWRLRAPAGPFAQRPSDPRGPCGALGRHAEASGACIRRARIRARENEAAQGRPGRAREGSGNDREDQAEVRGGVLEAGDRPLRGRRLGGGHRHLRLGPLLRPSGGVSLPGAKVVRERQPRAPRGNPGDWRGGLPGRPRRESIQRGDDAHCRP